MKLITGKDLPVCDKQVYSILKVEIIEVPYWICVEKMFNFVKEQKND